jgi:hypothetical protein
MRAPLLLAVGLAFLTGWKERPEAVPAPKPVVYDCPDQRQRVEHLSQPWLTITEFTCTATS